MVITAQGIIQLNSPSVPSSIPSSSSFSLSSRPSVEAAGGLGGVREQSGLGAHDPVSWLDRQPFRERAGGL